MKTKRIFFIMLVAAFIGVNSASAQLQVIKPGKGKFNTAFAVVIDKASLQAAQTEVMAYKAVLESEGLAVYVLADDWKSPEAVKEQLIKLYKGKPLLEGVVFVGQIPIVRVRNAQHMTTAFKMDELAFPMKESSVTSDRFYDDLHLRFERITQEEGNPLIYYYKLMEDSPQEIRPSFYSARMLPPSDKGQDAAALLRAYLQKVVAAHKENNALDCFVSFSGHGYNSDCLTAWSNEPLVMREYFPMAFGSSKNNAFFNFRQEPYFKYRLYDQLQRPEVDFFIFHEHGAFDTQYINGSYPATTLEEQMAQLGITFRSGLRRRSGEKAIAYEKEAIEKYNIPASWLSQKNLDSLRVSDSITGTGYNIVLEDIAQIHPNPRFSIFDACYNGSFHQKGYVAGYHVFGDGKTVVAQGNTVNVLQDKWSTELLGLLSHGARVGFWQNEVITLESHLIGDPTYRFVPPTASQQQTMQQLNADLALHRQDAAVWKHYLTQDDPTLQAIALKKLALLRPANFAKQLYDCYNTSPYLSVRMECVRLLADYPKYGEPAYAQDVQYRTNVLVRALTDYYELTRRMAGRYAGFVGDPALIPPMVQAVLQQSEAQRLAYQAQSSLAVFDQALVTTEYQKQVAAFPFMNKEELSAQITKGQQYVVERKEAALKRILSKEGESKQRLSDIRSLRNNNQHTQVKELLQVLNDPEEDVLIRTTLAEALGWFTRSVEKPQIIEAIKHLLQQKTLPAELKAELIQTLGRLDS